jgi:murein DD-endopeptidase MepM/ murein hydrolase activator NlpD
MNMKKQRAVILCLTLSFVLVATGCSSSFPQPPTPTPVMTTPTFHATTTPSPSHTATQNPTPAFTATLQPAIKACSPLKDIELSDLHKIMSQGFTPPAPYKDDGHPAIDLAFFTFKELPSMIGHPVQSIFPGIVNLVIVDRFPYGNAVLIETPLNVLSAEWVSALPIPTAIPQENLDLVRPCDSDPLFADMTPIEWDGSRKSVYVLYAHLLEKPSVRAGDVVNCGQVIGAAGNTGNSAAEHLHLEARVGPAGAQFGTLAMYSPDATIEERYRYCIWSSSGRFQSFNPVILWEQEP